MPLWDEVDNEDDLYYCNDCGMTTEYREDLYDDYGDLVCGSCYDERYNSGDDDLASEYETDHGLGSFRETYVEVPRVSGSLILPELPGYRDPRLISWEQEVGRGGRWLAEALYTRGLTHTDEMLGYHSGSRDKLYVEHDSSVAGEVIYSKLDLSITEDAALMERGLAVVREGIREDRVKLDMRCGGHVHVDARGMAMQNIVSLYTLWNHVEEVMYQIGAAFWRCHRSAAGNDYSEPTPKGLTGRGRVGVSMGYGRYALNISNYLSARSACSCGAQYEDWAACTCNLRKPTIEFRVWNTTANARKVNAYTALSLAMVEYARRNNCNIRQFPVRAWDPGRWADTHHTSPENYVPSYRQAKRPINFILNDLALTEYERDNVIYCIKNSKLAEIYDRMEAA